MKKRNCLLGFVAIFLVFLSFAPGALADSIPLPQGESAETAALASGNALSPNLVVSKFSFGGDAVTAGKSFTLTYTLYNTNKAIRVENVLVKISGEEYFTLKNESDTYYVEKIAATGTVQHSSTFNTSVEMASGSYPISLEASFEYYDNGVKYNGASSLKMSIPVAQEKRVSILKAGIGIEGENLIQGEEYSVDYDFINTGFVKMLNTKLFLYDDDNGEELASAYLGTVNPATEMAGSSSLYVTFDEIGTENLKFVVSYEDVSMNTLTMEQPFTVTVAEPLPPIETAEDQNEGSFLFWAISLIAVLAAGSVLLVVLLRKRRQKKQRQEALWDEEDEEIAEDSGDIIATDDRQTEGENHAHH